MRRASSRVTRYALRITLKVNRIPSEVALRVDLSVLRAAEATAGAVGQGEEVVKQCPVHLGERLVDRQPLVLGQHQRLQLERQYIVVAQAVLVAAQLVAEGDDAPLVGQLV